MIRKLHLYPILFVLLLGQFSEMMPLLHPHEAEHHCVEIGGDHFELTESELRVPVSSSNVRGLKYDPDHHHHVCALCQLVPTYLKTSAKLWITDWTSLGHGAFGSAFRDGQSLDGHPARGPPICS